MKKFVLITQNDCIYCSKAINLLQEKGLVDYIRFNCSDHSVFKSFLAANGFTTVPQIYLNGEHIGGYDDLVQLLSEGGL